MHDKLIDEISKQNVQKCLEIRSPMLCKATSIAFNVKCQRFTKVKQSSKVQSLLQLHLTTNAEYICISLSVTNRTTQLTVEQNDVFS